MGRPFISQALHTHNPSSFHARIARALHVVKLLYPRVAFAMYTSHKACVRCARDGYAVCVVCTYNALCAASATSCIMYSVVCIPHHAPCTMHHAPCIRRQVLRDTLHLHTLRSTRSAQSTVRAVRRREARRVARRVVRVACNVLRAYCTRTARLAQAFHSQCARACHSYRPRSAPALLGDRMRIEHVLHTYCTRIA